MGSLLDIQTSGSMKYLGVEIDTKLHVSTHILAMSADLHSWNCALSDGQGHTAVSQALCNSLIISRLDNCSTLLIGTFDKYIKRLQKVMNEAVRIVLRTNSNQFYDQEIDMGGNRTKTFLSHSMPWCIKC